MSSSHLLPLREALQDQQVCLAQAPFKLLLLPWGPGVREVLCASFKSGVCVSHSPLALLEVSLGGLQSQTFWGLVFPGQDPQAGEPDVGLGPLTPRGEPLQLSFSSCLWVAYLGRGVVDWTIRGLGPSCPCHCGSFFISLVADDLFC